jgi:hypothetical protein
MAKKSSSASILPLVVAGLAVLISCAIYLLTRTVADAFLLHLLGYLLTPLAVALCLGWDSIAQRIGKGNDPWFSANSKFSLVIRLLTGVSFLVAVPHIVAMATDIAEKFAGQG